MRVWALFRFTLCLSPCVSARITQICNCPKRIFGRLIYVLCECGTVGLCMCTAVWVNSCLTPVCRVWRDRRRNTQDTDTKHNNIDSTMYIYVFPTPAQCRSRLLSSLSLSLRAWRTGVFERHELCAGSIAGRRVKPPKFEFIFDTIVVWAIDKRKRWKCWQMCHFNMWGFK